MPQSVVEIPGVGVVEFPESMTPEQVNAAAAKLYQEAQPRTQNALQNIRSAGVEPVASHAPAGQSQGYWEDRGIAGARWHPASGVRESDRPDNSLFGMPPELAVTSGIGIARGAIGAGVGAAKRVMGGVRAAAGAAAPAIKYELTKSGLEAVGVPSGASIPIAIAVSGTGTGPRRPRVPRTARGRTATPAAEAPAAASPASLVASTPAAPAPPAARATPESVPTSSAGSTRTPHPEGGVWSPQRVANEVGIASRRSGAQLSQAEYQKAAELVTQGSTPADAVKAIVSARASAPATASAGTVARAKLSVTEGRVYAQLIGQGKTHDEAIESILLQRQLQQRLGTPKQDEVVRRVVNRNVTGRWAE